MNYIVQQKDFWIPCMLIPMINRPTRVTRNSCNQIDNIFINNYSIDSQLFNGILKADISDHYILFHIIKSTDSTKDVNSDYKTVRIVNGSRINGFVEKNQNADWSVLNSHRDCQTYFAKFYALFKTVDDGSFPLKRINKANLRDLIAATGLVILLKFDPNHRFFVPCDLEIWWMALENNRAPLLYYTKLCASFQIHRWIQIGITVRKRSIWVKIGNLLSRVTLKFDRWHRKTIEHLFYVASSFVYHFTAISEFKLELQSGNAQFWSKWMIFLAVWP